MLTTDKYVFFWSGIFSQWHKCKIKLGELEFNCAEQVMMYHKAQLFKDVETALKILKEKNPREQKALGRQVKNFHEGDWNLRARDYVYKGNWLKFKQNLDLYKQLMETGDRILVEASPKDKIWGIGLAEDNPNCLDESKWQGKNWLGEVLTKLRNDFREEVKVPPGGDKFKYSPVEIFKYSWKGN